MLIGTNFNMKQGQVMNMYGRIVKFHAYVTLYCIKPRQVAMSGVHNFGGTIPVLPSAE